jgi:dTDP-4-dehydrorhamnose 3,5-epimerase
MRYRELPVKGCFEIDLEPRGDDRGWFSRLFCEREFADHGLVPEICQINNSFSAETGTLRGMHFQRGPAAETKLVRAIKGSLFDVVIDLREESPTYGSWAGIEISSERRNMVYVPRGCAHGILTLEPETELLYAVSAQYDPSSEGGVRWDDPLFDIDWPQQPFHISHKDRSWPLWQHGESVAIG